MRGNEDRDIRYSDELFRSAFDNANVGMCIVSLDGRLLRVNAEMSRIFGYDKAELESMTVNDIAHSDSRTVSPAFIGTAVNSSEHDHAKFDKDYIAKDGSTVHGQVSSSLVRDSAGTPLFFISHVLDVTLERRLASEVHQLAFYDPLTKLANRRLLLDRLTQTMAKSERTGLYSALMLLDLDNLKSLNDKHGHQAGDVMLAELASRLSSCVRKIDTVARFGGDEFVVVLDGLDSDLGRSAAQADVVAEKIRTTCEGPYALTVADDVASCVVVNHICTVSIGVVLFIDHDATDQDLLKWADHAMYQAKNKGKNLVQFHNYLA